MYVKLTCEMVRTDGGVQGLHSSASMSPNLHLTLSPSGSKADRVKTLWQFEGTLAHRNHMQYSKYKTHPKISTVTLVFNNCSFNKASSKENKNKIHVRTVKNHPFNPVNIHHVTGYSLRVIDRDRALISPHILKILENGKSCNSKAVMPKRVRHWLKGEKCL